MIHRPFLFRGEVPNFPCHRFWILGVVDHEMVIQTLKNISMGPIQGSARAKRIDLSMNKLSGIRWDAHLCLESDGGRRTLTYPF